jgi:hypothetical protein
MVPRMMSMMVMRCVVARNKCTLPFRRTQLAHEAELPTELVWRHKPGLSFPYPPFFCFLPGVSSSNHKRTRGLMHPHTSSLYQPWWLATSGADAHPKLGPGRLSAPELA